MKKTTIAAVSVVTVAALFGLAGCAKGGSTAGDSDGTITLWTHNAGNDAELGAIQQIVDDYNGSQKKYTVKVQAFPQDGFEKTGRRTVKQLRRRLNRRLA